MTPSAFGDPDFKDLSMRQQLARAIYNVVWSRPPYSELALPAPVDGNPHSDPWLRAADECIRQMEWTHIASKWANPESLSYSDAMARETLEDGPLKLTLAPADWKAE
jgi:hypothetical protein